MVHQMALWLHGVLLNLCGLRPPEDARDEGVMRYHSGLSNGRRVDWLQTRLPDDLSWEDLFTQAAKLPWNLGWQGSKGETYTWLHHAVGLSNLLAYRCYSDAAQFGGLMYVLPVVITGEQPAVLTRFATITDFERGSFRVRATPGNLAAITASFRWALYEHFGVQDYFPHTDMTAIGRAAADLDCAAVWAIARNPTFTANGPLADAENVGLWRTLHEEQNQSIVYLSGESLVSQCVAWANDVTGKCKG